jgi:hypothetical protein
MRRLAALLFLGLAAATPACFSTGMYRTAKVLPKGEGDFAMNFSVVRLTMENPVKNAADSSGTSSGLNDKNLTFTYPNLIPELSYHYGAGHDIEVGGRIVLGAGMIELDTKYRFIGTDTSSVHLAVQPAVGYQGYGVVEGVHLSAPLILTYDFNEDVSLNTAAFGSFAHYASTIDNGSNGPDLSGNTVVAGGAVGVQFRSAGGFHFMPAIEVQRALSHSGDVVSEMPKYTVVLFGITFGWGPNRKLDRIEHKVDVIDQKLDRMDQKIDKLQPKQ